LFTRYLISLEIIISELFKGLCWEDNGDITTADWVSLCQQDFVFQILEIIYSVGFVPRLATRRFQTKIQCKIHFLSTLNENGNFTDELFRTLAVAPSVGLFSKLATKPTKPIIASI
jgi:hypothetical protein